MPTQAATVIVVTYNSAHCIERLSVGLRTLHHVIVVDNGSADDTLSMCARFLPQARVLALNENLGFGAANNKALAMVTTPYALLLNPDCEITPESIEQLCLSAQAQPDVAILVPQIFDKPGHPTLNYGWVKHLWASKSSAAEGLCCVGYASGAVMLVNMAVTHAHAYFDEAFFLYYEDDDLCLKYFNARLPILVVPQASALHASRGGVRSKSIVKQEFWRGYHHAQSKILIIDKYQGYIKAQNKRWLVFIGAIPMVLLRVLTLNPQLGARMVGRMFGLLRYKPFKSTH